MPRERVDAPPITVPRCSLLVAAPTIDDSARWEAGIKFAPELCAGGGRVPVECRGGTEALDPDDNPGTVTNDPFVVWASDICSTIGYQARDYVGRALRQLQAIQSFEIAEELWSGSLNGDTVLLGDNEVIDNLPLNDASSNTITAAATTPVLALAATVGALGKCGKGRQGMIHMTSQVMQHLIFEGALYQVSGLWYSAMGHLVVADDGYDGSGPGDVPAGATQWMYGTSMLRVRLGAIQTIPNIANSAPDGNFAPEDLAGNVVGWPAAVDPATNFIVVYAQRPALVEWDQCCHVAAEVALPIPVIGPPS